MSSSGPRCCWPAARLRRRPRRPLPVGSPMGTYRRAQPSLRAAAVRRRSWRERSQPGWTRRARTTTLRRLMRWRHRCTPRVSYSATHYDPVTRRIHPTRFSGWSACRETARRSRSAAIHWELPLRSSLWTGLLIRRLARSTRRSSMCPSPVAGISTWPGPGTRRQSSFFINSQSSRVLTLTFIVPVAEPTKTPRVGAASV